MSNTKIIAKLVEAGHEDLAERLVVLAALPPGFEGFDVPESSDTRSARKKLFEDARKGGTLKVKDKTYKVRKNHGYVDLKGKPYYMVLVIDPDAKLIPHKGNWAKEEENVSLLLNLKNEAIEVYPWATTKTDSSGVPRSGKPTKVIALTLEDLAEQLVEGFGEVSDGQKALKVKFPSHDVMALNKLEDKLDAYVRVVRPLTKDDPKVAKHYKMYNDALDALRTAVVKLKRAEEALYY